MVIKRVQLLTVLEPLFESSVDLFLSFVFPLRLQVDESLGHLFADLLGGFEVGHELLLVDAVLRLQQRLQSTLITITLRSQCFTSVGVLPGWTPDGA